MSPNTTRFISTHCHRCTDVATSREEGELVTKDWIERAMTQKEGVLSLSLQCFGSFIAGGVGVIKKAVTFECMPVQDGGKHG